MNGTEETPKLQEESLLNQKVVRAIELMETKNLEEIGQKSGIRFWKKEGFNFYDSVKYKDGSFIEIAGPTPDGYNLVDISKLDRKLFTSNLEEELPLFTGGFINPGEKPGRIKSGIKVDFVAKGEEMPLGDQSTGAVFLSNCPGSPLIYQEVYRILKDDGLFIAQGMGKSDLVQLMMIGFTVNQLWVHVYYPGNDPNRQRELRMEGVFQKGVAGETFDIEQIAQASKHFRPPIDIPKFDLYDGHPLTDAEKVEAMRDWYERRLQIAKIPTHDKEGKPLTVEKQLEFIRQNYIN